MRVESFETELLRYRVMTEEDTEVVLKLRNSDHVRHNFIYQAIITPKEHLYYFDSQVKTGKVIQFVMEEKSTGKPIGCTLLKDIDYKISKAEFGIFIGDIDALGKGYGTDAVNQMIRLAFKELKLHKLVLRVLSHNKVAFSVYSKAGFREEGRFVDDIVVDGTYRDVINMALFNSEV